jgi:hypothetical protein
LALKIGKGVRRPTIFQCSGFCSQVAIWVGAGDVLDSTKCGVRELEPLKKWRSASDHPFFGEGARPFARIAACSAEMDYPEHVTPFERSVYG